MSIAGRRDDIGAKLVTVGVRVIMFAAEKIAGDVTYPAAGLAQAIDNLDADTFGDFCSEGGTERVADFLAGEAEAYYEAMMESRRKELVDAGHIEWTTLLRPTRTGRQARVWNRR